MEYIFFSRNTECNPLFYRYKNNMNPTRMSNLKHSNVHVKTQKNRIHLWSLDQWEQTIQRVALCVCDIQIGMQHVLVLVAIFTEITLFCGLLLVCVWYTEVYSGCTATGAQIFTENTPSIWLPSVCDILVAIVTENTRINCSEQVIQ